MDNFVHHLSTLVLVAMAFGVNVMRAALLTLCLFNFTNPLLNGSRVCHLLQMQRAKKALFLFFAVS